MNRLQPRRVQLRTEKQCPQGLKPSNIVFFLYGLKPVPFTPFTAVVFLQPVKPHDDSMEIYAGDKSPAYPKTGFFRSL